MELGEIIETCVWGAIGLLNFAMFMTCQARINKIDKEEKQDEKTQKEIERLEEKKVKIEEQMTLAMSKLTNKTKSFDMSGLIKTMTKEKEDEKTENEECQERQESVRSDSEFNS